MSSSKNQINFLPDSCMLTADTISKEDDYVPTHEWLSEYELQHPDAPFLEISDIAKMTSPFYLSPFCSSPLSSFDLVYDGDGSITLPLPSLTSSGPNNEEFNGVIKDGAKSCVSENHCDRNDLSPPFINNIHQETNVNVTPIAKSVRTVDSVSREPSSSDQAPKSNINESATRASLIDEQPIHELDAPILPSPIVSVPIKSCKKVEGESHGTAAAIQVEQNIYSNHQNENKRTTAIEVIQPERYTSSRENETNRTIPVATMLKKRDASKHQKDSKRKSSGCMRSLPKKKSLISKNGKKEERIYVDDITAKDVLLGRGGRTNHHPGNKRYRNEVGKMQKWYLSVKKEEKTSLAEMVIAYVHGYGGRFLKEDPSTRQWYIVPAKIARRKASQALREHNTPEERAMKKAKYSK